MVPHTQALSSHYLPSILPSTQNFSKQISFSTSLSCSIKPIKLIQFNPSNKNPCLKSSFHPLKCSISISEPIVKELQKKPFPAEVSRTIMELSSIGTLSTLTEEGWPLGVGVRFAVDPQGTPVFCLNASKKSCLVDRKSSLHVQLEESSSRTRHCTLQGKLEKPEDITNLKRLHSVWTKRFGEEVDEDLLYVVSVERVLQTEDFKEEGIWVSSSEYRTANPDPLRDFAEKIVNEINTNHLQDFERICNIYVDSEFQVEDAKMIWVDRLGFDVHIRSQNDIFEARIPFPREVTDEKGAKSSFNCMSQLAWEVEKNYIIPEFEKVKLLKQIR